MKSLALFAGQASSYLDDLVNSLRATNIHVVRFLEATEVSLQRELSAAPAATVAKLALGLSGASRYIMILVVFWISML
jgi:hypothetical protein